MSFDIGDRVYASDWCEGTIVDIEGNIAFVEYETSNGGGCVIFDINDLSLVPLRPATMTISKTVHGTVNVTIQNCSLEVRLLLENFDIFKSDGKFEYDENKPKERPTIQFECPIEFLHFINSSMGDILFKRMGVEKIDFIDKDMINDNYDMINKIASFLEREDNWQKLKNCWIVNGKSDVLRTLLRQAINNE